MRRPNEAGTRGNISWVECRLGTLYGLSRDCSDNTMSAHYVLEESIKVQSPIKIRQIHPKATETSPFRGETVWALWESLHLWSCRMCQTLTKKNHSSWMLYPQRGCFYRVLHAKPISVTTDLEIGGAMWRESSKDTCMCNFIAEMGASYCLRKSHCQVSEQDAGEQIHPCIGISCSIYMSLWHCWALTFLFSGTYPTFQPEVVWGLQERQRGNRPCHWCPSQPTLCWTPALRLSHHHTCFLDKRLIFMEGTWNRNSKSPEHRTVLWHSKGPIDPLIKGPWNSSARYL